MVKIWTIIAAVTSFGIAALFGIWLIPFLKKVHFQQTEREEGIDLHKSKQGTPMMGGFMFILSSIVSGIGCVLLYNAIGGTPETPLMCAKIYAGIFMALAFGAIGFMDDYIKAVKKRNLGLTPKQKLLLQFLAAAAYLATVYFFGGGVSVDEYTAARGRSVVSEGGFYSDNVKYQDCKNVCKDFPEHHQHILRFGLSDVLSCNRHTRYHLPRYGHRANNPMSLLSQVCGMMER